MKTVVAMIVGLITLVALGYLAFMQYPTTQTFNYKVAKMVPENRTRSVTKEVLINGEMVTATFDEEYTVTKPVWETRTLERPATIFQKLQFAILVGVAIIFGIYMLVLIVTLARDKITNRRTTNDTRDTQKRVDGLVTFCTGALVGFLGRSDFSQPTPQPAPSNFQSVDEAFDSEPPFTPDQKLLIPIDIPAVPVEPLDLSPAPAE